jgi:hypothetical protein
MIDLDRFTASLADLDEPPEGIDCIRVGDRIELIEDGECRGIVEVLSIWTRGVGRLPEERPDA